MMEREGDSGTTHQVMINSDISWRYGLSLVHKLVYAASRGSKERNLVAGSYVQGEASAADEFDAPFCRPKGAGCAGSSAE